MLYLLLLYQREFKEQRLRSRKTETEESLMKRIKHAKEDLIAGSHNICSFLVFKVVLNVFIWKLIHIELSKLHLV